MNQKRIDELVADALQPELRKLYRSTEPARIYQLIRIVSPSLDPVRDQLILAGIHRQGFKLAKNSTSYFIDEKRHASTKCNIRADQKSGSSIQRTALAEVS